MRRDRAACAREGADAAALCERFEFAYYGHWGRLLGAWAAMRNDPLASLATMETALRDLDAEGAWARRPLYLAALAEAQAHAGREDAARVSLDDAEARAANSGERLWSAEIARLRATLGGPGAEAEARRALQIARGMGARPLALRAAVTLARLQQAGGGRATARAVVRAALAALPDGGTSRDRRQALTLLAKDD